MALSVLNAAGATTSIQDTLVGTTHVMMSIPTDVNGTAAWGTFGAPNTNVLSVQSVSTATPFPIVNATAGNLTGLMSIFQGGATAIVTTGAPAAGQAGLNVKISPDGINPNGATSSANSAPVVLALNQPTIAVMADVTQLANGASGSTLVMNFTSVLATTNGTLTLVAGVASKKISVVNLWLSANGTTNVNFQSATTSITGTATLWPAAGMVLPESKLGWFQTVAGQALVINLSATASVGGSLSYVTF